MRVVVVDDDPLITMALSLIHIYPYLCGGQ